MALRTRARCVARAARMPFIGGSFVLSPEPAARPTVTDTAPMETLNPSHAHVAGSGRGDPGADDFSP
ncbi:MAG: hypothetical protein JNL19_16430 [Burkholderiales bacterium]|nr:hypothetical protein [Burkholderiales bacterium]